MMGSPALYPSFKRVRKESTGTANKPTHLRNRPPGRKAPRQRNPSEQVFSLRGCFSPVNVNPSLSRAAMPVRPGYPGDRERVFAKNTKMKTTTKSNTIQATSYESDELTESIDRFDRPAQNRSNGKSPHGEGELTELTDLTCFLRRGGSIVCPASRGCNVCASLPPEGIGQIGQIGSGPSSVVWFSFDRRRSTGYKSGRSIGQIGVDRVGVAT